MKYLIILSLLFAGCSAHKSVIERRKECNCEMVRWQTQLQDGKLTQSDYDFLVQSAKDLDRLKNISK